MRVDSSQLLDVLKRNGFSITRPRRLVFECLYTHGLLSMNQLIEKLTDVDRASVYRSVNTLERCGVISRVRQGFRYKLELSDLFLPHHHHMICVQCSRQQEVSSEYIEEALARIANEIGYSLTGHEIELRGVCPACLAKNPDLIKASSGKQSADARALTQVQL
jgi:Fur family ferric uptake transcriptional regulator